MPQEQLLSPTPVAVAKGAASHRHGPLQSLSCETVVARQFRRLAKNILNEFPRETGGTILFTGVGSDRHVADVAEHVARQLACHADVDGVALVDGDVETRSLTVRLADRGKPGLAEILRHRASLTSALVDTVISDIRFLPFGDRRDARNPIAPDAVKSTLADLRRMCCYTIVATGTNLTKLHAMLSRYSDGTYLVVRLGAAARQDTSAAANYLTRAGARLLGCIATSAI